MRFMVDTQKCTGCGACVQACPKQCIVWQRRDLGFLYPAVKDENCIHCGRCEQVCPIDQAMVTLSKQHAYALVHDDPKVLERSTSGGAFTLLADAVLKQGGAVYGCSMDSELKARHIRIADSNDLEKLHGSKYIQSEIGNCFRQAEADLKSGKPVLFTGTPCQIAGLKSFLGKEYDHLITADIVCHGVASQAFFDKYLEYVREKYGDVVEIRFRNKELSGWTYSGSMTVRKEDGNLRRYPYREDRHYYYYYYLRSESCRESCYSCRYASQDRPGDFTMADFWGVESLNVGFDTSHGCSLLLVNTEKAARIFKELKCKKQKEVSLQQAARMNRQLVAPVKKPESRNRLIKEYQTMTAKEMNASFEKNNRIGILKAKIKASVPDSIRIRARRCLQRMRKGSCHE